MSIEKEPAPISASDLPVSTPAPGSSKDMWDKLRLPPFRRKHPPVKNAREVQESQLSGLDKVALTVTNKVGSMGFFLLILAWTIVWTGYNILATEVTAFHWKPFDPFPAFVAYLLISNVIQILLMPLIMVGQNVQSRHSDIRADLDFQINQKAEQEVEAILQHLELNTELTIRLLRHLNCPDTLPVVSSTAP